jgi:hypothetical protein
MISSTEVMKNQKSNDAKRRLSYKCPVIKSMNQTLEGEFLDVVHALDYLLVDLKYMHEAAATRDILEKLKNIYLTSGEHQPIDKINDNLLPEVTLENRVAALELIVRKLYEINKGEIK